MHVLVLNTGSNSLKYELVASEPGAFGRKELQGVFDDIGHGGGLPDYGAAAGKLFDELERKKPRVDAMAHRVVHGADLFAGPVRIDAEVIRQIESLEDLAPLHNVAALEAIRTAQERAPEVPMYAVFDTVFHRDIPERAATYGLPLEVSRRHKIRRYGFHGLSHRYLTLQYAELTGRAVESTKLITLHLEGGSSAAAILNGISVDTSMGFTPLEGLVMGTRTGDLDPALVPYLRRKEGLDDRGLEELLNKKSGLLGLSGLSEDTRVLVKHLDDPRTVLALEVFAYRVRKYIGAYLAALNGAEAVVFGGGIGENTPVVRERICSGLEWFGLQLDPGRNRETVDCAGQITTQGSRLGAWVIPTEEGLMAAREVAEFVRRPAPDRC